MRALFRHLAFFAALQLALAPAIAYSAPVAKNPRQSFGGVVLPPEEASELYELINSIFDPLVEAQAKKFGHPVFPTLTIVKSPIVNASVRTPASGYFDVTLTTGIIREFLRNDQGAELPSNSSEYREGISRLAGVLAHELAHPLEKNHVAKIGGQASEIFADTVGSELAEEAGFPRESVLNALKRTFWNEEEQPRPKSVVDLAKAAAGTHPYRRTRQATNEVFLTLKRNKKGSSPTPTLDQLVEKGIPKTAMAQLAKWSKPKEFIVPSSIAEIAERYTVPPSQFQPDQNLLLERRLLARAFHRELETKGVGGLSHEEKIAAQTVLTKLAVDRELEAAENTADAKKEIAHELEKLKLPKDWNRYTDYFANMERIPYFHSTAHYDWIAKKLPEWRGDKDLKKGFPYSLTMDVEQILPVNETYRIIEVDLKKLLPEVKNAEENVLPLRQLNPRFLLAERIRNFYMKRSLLGASLDQILDAVHESANLPFFNSHLYSKGQQQTGWIKLRALSPELSKERKEIYQQIWNDRGKWSAVDLWSSQTIDWENIWGVLGIDHQLGNELLKSSFKKYSQTPEYARVLERKQSIWRGLGVSPPSWCDSDLWPYIIGEKLDLSPEIKAHAATEFRLEFINKYPDRMRKPIAHAIDDLYAAGDLATVRSPVLTAPIYQIRKKYGLDIYGGNVVAELVQGIDDSRLPSEVKRAALYSLSQSEPELTWFHNPGRGTNGMLRVLPVLKKYGLLTSAGDALEKLNKYVFQHMSYGKYSQTYADWYEKSVRVLEPELLREIARLRPDSPQGSQNLLEYAKLILSPDFPTTARKSKEYARKLQIKILDKAEELARHPESHFQLKDKISLFHFVAPLLPGARADDFFRRHLRDELFKPANRDLLQSLLDKGPFQSERLAVEAARHAIEPELNRSVKADPIEILFKLDRWLPHSSFDKDALLEDIAWNYELKKDELKQLVENRKTGNYANLNRTLVNKGSSAGAFIDSLDRKSRGELLEYLLDEDRGSVPQSIEQKLDSFAAELEQVSRLVPGVDIEKITENQKQEILQALSESTQMERVPMIHYILGSGPDSYSHMPDYPKSIIRSKLGYAPDSLQEKLLLAFLRTIPEHEQTTSLAYLLSLPKGEKTSLKPIFEVFSSVGIKFGQMASIWKLFGDAASKDLESLEDHATALSKAQIEEILDDSVKRGELTQGQRSSIRLKRILGSASIKSVVEVEVIQADGSIKKAALLIQRPDAKNLIRTNLELAKKFVLEAKAQGVPMPGGMFETLLDDIDLQMNRELDMKAEVQALEKARILFEEMNKTLKSTLGGYRFKVPQPLKEFPVTSSFFLTDLASGSSWNSLAASEKKVVGPSIVDSTLKIFQKFGWIDPDRHGGNFLVDPITKEISVIDLGQAEQLYKRASVLAPDDVYRFSQFIRAADSRDVRSITKWSKEIAKPGRPIPSDAILHKAIEQALKSEATADTSGWVPLINHLSEAGLRIDSKYTVGTMKGYMTLAGKGYVGPEEFKKKVSQQVKTTLLLNKPLLTLKDETKARANQCGSAIAENLRRLLQ